MRPLDRMSIGQLLAVIRQQPEGSDLRERALRQCLDELIEVEIEWRIDHRHLNQGYHKASTIAGIGKGRGEMTGCVDHVGEAAERYRHACRWRAMAQALLGHLNERQRMALLLCGYAIPEQRCAVLGGNEARMQLIKQGSRALTLAEVCEGQSVILKRMGWPAVGAVAIFEGSESLKGSAKRARSKLLTVVGEQASMVA
ncbi:hypothetical protein [Chromohalobacter moromii]|uniref:Uncharacterized protein n=1 Tax=Chromohalobacter moromii TaxID=2860329 RepID=A0A9X3AY29_9GAMM|nr:hypothetical protein [Chromohalobacter moromii]MCT8506157.1 hypothetical protein [Chromohalobacter moromii]